MTTGKLSRCVLALGVAAMIGGSAQAITAPTAFAAPFVKIDHGEYQGNMHVWWNVDKGTAAVKGQPPKDTLCITAIKTDGYTDVEMRKYRFRQKNGQWYYMWEGLTGKGAPISSGLTWRRVSHDRVANDVLYIAQH